MNLKVGDYGKLNEMTGEFDKDGNIYDDEHIYKDQKIAQLVKDHPPITAPQEDVYVAASTRVKRGDLKLGGEA